MNTIELYSETTGLKVTTHTEMVQHFQGLSLQGMDRVIGPLVDRVTILEDPEAVALLSRIRLNK